MYNGSFAVNTKTEVITVKDKLDVILKKLQSYSFILFIGLLVIAFTVVFAISQLRDRADDDTSTTDDTSVLNPDPNDISHIFNERFEMPVVGDVKYEIIRYHILDKSLSPTEHLTAVINHGNGVYTQNYGINIKAEDNSTFQVGASASGKVIKVEQDDQLGVIVEIEHTDNLKTRYYSLSEANVSVGQMVQQGDVIGKSGENFDTESGNHVHFEILVGNQRLNPRDMIGRQLKEFVNTQNEE